MAICGVTAAELYAGIRSDADYDRNSGILRTFGRVPIPDNIWEGLGLTLYALRTRGIQVSFPDALIAATALHHDLELWTHDAEFLAIQRIIPALRLFKEPEEQQQ